LLRAKLFPREMINQEMNLWDRESLEGSQNRAVEITNRCHQVLISLTVIVPLMSLATVEKTPSTSCPLNKHQVSISKSQTPHHQTPNLPHHLADRKPPKGHLQQIQEMLKKLLIRSQKKETTLKKKRNMRRKATQTKSAVIVVEHATTCLRIKFQKNGRHLAIVLMIRHKLLPLSWTKAMSREERTIHKRLMTKCQLTPCKKLTCTAQQILEEVHHLTCFQSLDRRMSRS